MPKFKIDLVKPEFATQLEESELWQSSAWDNLFEMLDKAIVGAKTYSQQRKETPKEYAAYHNAIYVYGGRGSGKTVFLKNIKRRWQLISGNNANLHITDTIDPTLLQNHDSFANVVVAQIYNEVEYHYKNNAVDDDVKQGFYKSLKSLADAMAQNGELDDHVGIDRIIKYRSGVQIESLFHQFIESACQSLGASAIAVPIDDVDMALTKAFDVLDVVRRLLSCPLVVPIVSGDTNLYEKITELHFQQELKNASNAEELAQKLNVAYLTKIFPNQYRIGLVGVNEILPSLSIKGEGIDRSYRDYKEALLNRYYYLTNGEERSHSWPEPETPREIQQLLSTIPLENKSSIVPQQEWAAFKQWAEQKQHGPAYTNAESVRVGNDLDLNEFKLSELMAFSPLLQNKANFSWAAKDYAKEQTQAIRRLSRESDRSGNQKLVDAALGADFRVLRSMPPIELHTNSMIVPGEDGKKNTMVIAMYTHHDYYTTMANTTAKVFFSRAFELLVASLIKPELTDEATWNEYLSGLIKRPPFYCIHAISPTKYVNDGIDDDDKFFDDGDNIEADTSVSLLAKEMVDWQLRHKDLLDRVEKEPSLLPLAHSVFNKVFSLLQLLKENGDVPVPSETLKDLIKRFEYITVNAFASFLVKGSVIVKANTAQTKTLEILRDYKAFKSSERVFTRNVSHLVGLDSRKAINKQDIRGLLIEAIWDHPIFNLLQNDETAYFLEKRTSSSSHTEKGKEKKLPSPKSKMASRMADVAGGYGREYIAEWALRNLTTQDIDEAIKTIESEISKYPHTKSGKTKVMGVLNGLKLAKKRRE